MKSYIDEADMKTFESSMGTEFDGLLALREQELCDILRAREAQHDRTGASSDVNDFKDLAGEDSQAAVDEAQAEHAALELEQVLAARRRLHEKAYGSCLECGEAIDLRRLCAMPATRYCTSCQSAHEHDNSLLTRH
jgi:DnaK suppressor protein